MAINRREALKKAAYFMGGAISAPTILGVMQGCAPEAKPGWTPSFFSKIQALTIQELSETIYPATDTLGAKDLGVPEFVERMVGAFFKEKDQDRFMAGLDAFIQEIEQKYDKAFHELTAEEKLSVAKEKNDFIVNRENQKAWDQEPPFFWSVKELTLIGFFTSEYGATQILQYQLVPGQWEACIPLSEAGEGRTYATA